LTVRYDIPAPRFVHGFVYEGEEGERAALKAAMQKVAAKAGIDTETWLQSVVTPARRGSITVPPLDCPITMHNPGE
jgi:hypothetical protein